MKPPSFDSLLSTVGTDVLSPHNLSPLFMTSSPSLSTESLPFNMAKFPCPNPAAASQLASPFAPYPLILQPWIPTYHSSVYRYCMKHHQWGLMVRKPTVHSCSAAHHFHDLLWVSHLVLQVNFLPCKTRLITSAPPSSKVCCEDQMKSFVRKCTRSHKALYHPSYSCYYSFHYPWPLCIMWGRVVICHLQAGHMVTVTLQCQHFSFFWVTNLVIIIFHSKQILPLVF